MRLLLATRDRAIGVEDGHIVPVEGRFDAVIDLPDGEIHPGLINAHDHLHRNHYGRLGRPPYANAYEWARDIQVRHRGHIANHHRLLRREALLAGAWKNLFAGVTTVVHHDPWEADFDRDFPVRVLPLRSADSIGMAPDLAAIADKGIAGLHVAEGVDNTAADEVRTLDAKGLLGPDLIAVHMVGVDSDGIDRFRASGAGLVWCPTSNLFLFGRTAPRALFDGPIDVMLGSDSLLTGDGDLLDEIRCARALGMIEDQQLEQAVGATAARRLGLRPPSLKPGEVADLVVLAAPLLRARSEDVALVIAGGIPRVVRPDLVPVLGPFVGQGTSMTVGRVVRWVNKSAQVAQKGRQFT